MTAIAIKSEPDDCTRVDAQPSRAVTTPTTTTRAIWLIVGALLAATGIAVLAPMIALSLPTVAVAGILLIVVCYAVMLSAQLLAPPGRVGLRLLAAGMTGIAVVAVGCAALITATELSLLP